jgi:hypothetical protein
MRLFARFLLLAGLCVATVPALAQTKVTADVVTACGTPNATYTAGQGQPVTQDTSGNGCIVESPFAAKASWLSGSASTASATNTSLIAAQATGIKIYLTGFSCANSGASISLITFTSGSGGTALWYTTVAASGGTSSGVISPPVATAAATALYMTTGTASTTIYCSVTGFAAP